MAPSDEKCQVCWYWRPQRDLPGGTVGRCTRYPPLAIANRPGVWALTDEADWCGEFRKGELVDPPQ